jgi:hypothetical protein
MVAHEESFAEAAGTSATDEVVYETDPTGPLELWTGPHKG